MYGTPLNWGQIKENLITHYADKRNETSLIRDLHTLYQGNDTLERYFSKVIDIQSTLINHVKLNESNLTVRTTKENLYKEMCLATFLAGIKEPMGSMIRARIPTSIAEAFSLCLSEQNMHYIKHKSYIHGPPVPPKRINTLNLPLSKLPTQQYQQWYQPRIHIPQNNYPPKPLNSGNVYYNHRPFSRPTHGQFPNNNFSQNSRPPLAILPPKLQPRKFEPMDTVSNQNKYTQPTMFPQNRFPTNNFNRPPLFQQKSAPRFVSQELFNAEELNMYSEEDIYNNTVIQDDNFDNTPNYVPDLDSFQEEILNVVEEEPDEEVFQQEASETQLA